MLNVLFRAVSRFLERGTAALWSRVSGLSFDIAYSRARLNSRRASLSLSWVGLLARLGAEDGDESVGSRPWNWDVTGGTF